MGSNFAVLKWLEKIVRRNYRSIIPDPFRNSGPIWLLLCLGGTSDDRGHGDSGQEDQFYSTYSM
jgi:hypothetical protein